MPDDHLAHLQHPSVQLTERAFTERAFTEHLARCGQCQAAPGPPPAGIRPEDRVLYACDEGIRLSEAAVLAAHAAYREAHPDDE